MSDKPIGEPLYPDELRILAGMLVESFGANCRVEHTVWAMREAAAMIEAFEAWAMCNDPSKIVYEADDGSWHASPFHRVGGQMVCGAGKTVSAAVLDWYNKEKEAESR